MHLCGALWSLRSPESRFGELVAILSLTLDSRSSRVIIVDCGTTKWRERFRLASVSQRIARDIVREWPPNKSNVAGDVST